MLALAQRIPDPDLWEWDYGGYEGRTTQEIQAGRPGWYLWRDGVIPGDADHPGETVEQVGERADRVLARVRPLLERGNVALVAHAHVLRVLTARWLQLEPSGGRLFRLDTGTISDARHRARHAGHPHLECSAGGRLTDGACLRRSVPFAVLEGGVSRALAGVSRWRVRPAGGGFPPLSR